LLEDSSKSRPRSSRVLNPKRYTPPRRDGAGHYRTRIVHRKRRPASSLAPVSITQPES
jgi:hypothetical protein